MRKLLALSCLGAFLIANNALADGDHHHCPKIPDIQIPEVKLPDGVKLPEGINLPEMPKMPDLPKSPC